MNRILTVLVVIVFLAAGGALYLMSEQASENAAVKPQTPKPPYPYAVEEFVVENNAQGVRIGGTLTVPAGEGPFPAVVLLSVGGPNDRDQSFAGHKEFHVLADYLTRHGVAVVRFDDRGVGASTGDYFASSWSDLATDALAVVADLKTDARIDPLRIGVAGMSQGGAVGALASIRSDDIAFLVLMSAPGLAGEDALEESLEQAIKASHVKEARAAQYRALFDEFMGIMKSDPSAPSTRERLLQFLSGPGRALIPPYRFLPRDVEGLADVLLGAWYQSNIDFDPVAAYGAVEVPVLAIGGDKDVIAPPETHLSSIKRILEDAPTKDVTIRTIPGLNHLMQEADTGLPTEYAALENSFSPAALEIIEKWINQRAARAN